MKRLILLLGELKHTYLFLKISSSVLPVSCDIFRKEKDFCVKKNCLACIHSTLRKRGLIACQGSVNHGEIVGEKCLSGFSSLAVMIESFVRATNRVGNWPLFPTYTLFLRIRKSIQPFLEQRACWYMPLIRALLTLTSKSDCKLFLSIYFLLLNCGSSGTKVKSKTLPSLLARHWSNLSGFG